MEIEVKRVAAVVGDGFEESELLDPKRALEEAGAVVTIVGVDDRALQKIRGKKGLDEGQSTKAEEIVADVVVHRAALLRHIDRLGPFDLASDLLVLAIKQLAASKLVDRTTLGGGHEPGARVVRNTRLGPPLERRDERERIARGSHRLRVIRVDRFAERVAQKANGE